MSRWTEPPGWLYWRPIRFLRNPYVQIRLGAWAFVATMASWVPLRFLIVRLGEPEVVFHLSMLAVAVSAATLVVLTDIGEVTKD